MISRIDLYLQLTVESTPKRFSTKRLNINKFIKFIKPILNFQSAVNYIGSFWGVINKLGEKTI